MKREAWGRVVRLFQVRSDNGRPGRHRRDMTARTDYDLDHDSPTPRHRHDLEFVAVISNDWGHLVFEALEQPA